MSLARIDEELNKLKEETGYLLNRKLEILKNTPVLCMGCKCKHILSSYIFLQRRRDVTPWHWQSGSLYGDERTEVCNVICPSCEHISYLYNHPQGDEIVKIVDEGGFSKTALFKEVKKGRVGLGGYEQSCNT